MGIPAGPVWYSIYDLISGNREAGLGEFNGSDTIVRTTVHTALILGVYELNPVSPISLSGSSTVSCTLNSEAFKEQFLAADILYDSSIDPVTNLDNVQDAMMDHALSIEERDPSSTGLYTGGTLSQSGLDTFSVSAGSGLIVDNHTTPGNTGITPISWLEALDVPVEAGVHPFGGIRVFIDSIGSIVQLSTAMPLSMLRTNIFLGTLYVSNSTEITEVSTAPLIAKQTATTVLDNMFTTTGISGVEIYPVTGALQVWNGAGTVFFPNVNWDTDRTNPNIAAIVQLGDINTPAELNPINSEGAQQAATFDVPLVFNPDPNTYTPLTGQKATIHRLYSMGKSAARKLILLYGQNEYATASDARNNLVLDSENTVTPNASYSIYFLGYICVSAGAVDFSNADQAWISSSTLSASEGATVPTEAVQISYDNTTSGLTAITVQAAIDEIVTLLP
jgi:hypothetical protein